MCILAGTYIAIYMYWYIILYDYTVLYNVQYLHLYEWSSCTQATRTFHGKQKDVQVGIAVVNEVYKQVWIPLQHPTCTCT